MAHIVIILYRLSPPQQSNALTLLGTIADSFDEREFSAFAAALVTLSLFPPLRRAALLEHLESGRPLPTVVD